MDPAERRYDLPVTHATVPIVWLNQLLNAFYNGNTTTPVTEVAPTPVREGGVPRPDGVDWRQVEVSPGYGHPGQNFVPRGAAAPKPPPAEPDE